MAAFLSSLVIVLSLTTVFVAEAAVVAFEDPKYGKWPAKSVTDTSVVVPVYIDEPAYANDPFCLSNIKLAITAINADLAGCIQFSYISSPVGAAADFVYISARDGTGKMSPVCTTPPGRDASQARKGQRLLMGGVSAGAHNCCGTVRDVMRYLANVVGLRNEFLRADRQLTPIPGNVHASLLQNTVFTAYPISSPVAYWDPVGKSFYQYTDGAPAPGELIATDFNSVTMVTRTKYSAIGLPTWNYIAPASQPVGSLSRLSATDCEALHVLYQCPATSACPTTLPQ